MIRFLKQELASLASFEGQHCSCAVGLHMLKLQGIILFDHLIFFSHSLVMHACLALLPK